MSRMIVPPPGHHVIHVARHAFCAFRRLPPRLLDGFIQYPDLRAQLLEGGGLVLGEVLYDFSHGIRHFALGLHATTHLVLEESLEGSEGSFLSIAFFFFAAMMRT